MLLTRLFEGHPRLVSCCNSNSLWAHNPKVGGSNPPPATKSFQSVAAFRYKPIRSLCAHNCLNCQQLLYNLSMCCAFLLAHQDRRDEGNDPHTRAGGSPAHADYRG